MTYFKFSSGQRRNGPADTAKAYCRRPGRRWDFSGLQDRVQSVRQVFEREPAGRRQSGRVRQKIRPIQKAAGGSGQSCCR